MIFILKLLNCAYIFILFISGPSGAPGLYDPRLDTISVGPIGSQGDVGEDGERGIKYVIPLFEIRQ